MENIATEKGSPDYSFIIQLNLINKLKKITIAIVHKSTDFKEFVHIYIYIYIYTYIYCSVTDGVMQTSCNRFQ